MTEILRKTRWCVPVVLIALVSGATAWWRAFSTMRPFDDEGVMMYAAHRFLQGQVLYESVQSHYGPLFYISQWAAHVITGEPVSHHLARMVTVTYWTAAALLLLWLVYRATGSMVVAVAAHLAGFHVLAFLGQEVAHPQDICVCLLLGTALAASFRRPASAAWIGALAAALALTKINVGALTAVAFVMLFASRRWLAVAVGMGVSIPVWLMSAHIADGWAARFALLAAISLTASALAANRNKTEAVTAGEMAIAAAAGLAATTLIAGFALARGSTVPGMVRNLVIFPRTQLAQHWSIPMGVDAMALVWAVAMLAVAWRARRGRIPEPWIVGLKLALAAGTALAVSLQQYRLLVEFAAPMVWLAAIVPAYGAPVRSDALLRPLLAVFGVAQVLIAYPVAGAQVQMVCVMLVPVAAVCVADTLPWLSSRGPQAAGRWAAAAVILAAAILYPRDAGRAYLKYQSLEPVGLPGTQGLRLSPDFAASLRRISDAARPCTVLVSQPGLYSFNLMTGKLAPSAMYLEAWVLFMDESEQARVVRELDAQPYPCAIRSSEIGLTWTRGAPTPSRPLVRFLDEEFRVAFETGPYQFLVRK
jgi:hypothetical protein